MRVLALTLCAAACAAATATGFDGPPVSGPLGDGGAGQVKVGTTALRLADLDRLVLGEGPAPRLDGTFGVSLADGSWLPASAVAAADVPDAVVVTGPLGRLQLPLAAIAGWGDPDPPPTGSDDAISVESGVLRGRIQGLRDGKLAFAAAADPEPLSLPLTQVLGLRLAQAAPRPAGVRLRVQLAPSRPPLDLVLAGGKPALAAAPAVAIDPDVFGALPLRVEGGRRIYLGDLPTTMAREEGAFGVVWPHSTDRAIGGGPLLLGGDRWSKGLVVHSVAELGWSLAGAYTRLHARIGISDEVAPEGDLVAIILGDGRELWRARVRGGERPRDLDLDMAGVKTLSLKVELGERQDIGDHLALADAQLIRKKAD